MGIDANITNTEDFTLLIFKNETQEVSNDFQDIKMGLIQFHFLLKGKSKFIFNNGNYKLELLEGKSLLLYNPEKELPLNLILEPQSWVVSLLVPIQKFHTLFSEEANYISFLNADNINKKYYKENDINPSMAIVLSQILHFNLHPLVKDIYFKGKSYELLSLYFNRIDSPSLQQCPFLIDEENVIKIKLAKEIILRNIAEPPSLQSLADEIGLNIKKLKMGFKQIYGDTVYGFLFDYKMQYALKLLKSGSYNVNEVGLKIGYSTGSHFIEAFKKKFGTTPKKILMDMIVNN